jgi:hypothetical protein
MHWRVCADISVLTPGNFITDAIVRPSHRQSSGHRPSIRPSSIVRVTTLPGRSMTRVPFKSRRPVMTEDTTFSFTPLKNSLVARSSLRFHRIHDLKCWPSTFFVSKAWSCVRVSLRCYWRSGQSGRSSKAHVTCSSCVRRVASDTLVCCAFCL